MTMWDTTPPQLLLDTHGEETNLCVLYYIQRYKDGRWGYLVPAAHLSYPE